MTMEKKDERKSGIRMEKKDERERILMCYYLYSISALYIISSRETES